MAGATGDSPYPNRTVMIEGYTDSVGSEDYNQGCRSAAPTP
jgi:outer membrane protein OmpA-like peptidoglycan-associated protein